MSQPRETHADLVSYSVTMADSSPSRRELAALMRSTRRLHRNADETEIWTVKRLYEQITSYRDGDRDVVDPALARALDSLCATGAARTWWSMATMYRAEDYGADREPSQGRELVRLYDELFNAGQPHLMQIWEQIRIADPPRSQPSRRPRGQYPLAGDDVEWLADLTVPDGVEVPPNHGFMKSWRLYNSGCVPWVGRQLVRVGPATGFGLVRSAPAIPIADTQPGETVDIAVRVKAPVIETSHCEPRWKMADKDGNYFFPDKSYGIGMIIRVVAGAPVPDMEVPGAEQAAANKLARLRARRST